MQILVLSWIGNVEKSEMRIPKKYNRKVEYPTDTFFGTDLNWLRRK